MSRRDFIRTASAGNFAHSRLRVIENEIVECPVLAAGREKWRKVMEINIEKGFPAPQNRKGGPISATALQMEPGDSVWLPIRFRQNIGSYLKRPRGNGWTFTTQKEMRDGEEGFRLWRVS